MIRYFTKSESDSCLSMLNYLLLIMFLQCELIFHFIYDLLKKLFEKKAKQEVIGLE